MGRMGFWLALIFALVMACASPASAASGMRCSAASGETGPIAETLAKPVDWHCRDGWSALDQPRQLVRFTFDSDNPPRFLVARTAAFDRLTIAWAGHGGIVRSATHRFADLSPTYLDRRFAVPLPPEATKAGTVVVALDGTTTGLTLDYMTLAREEPGSSDADRDALLIVALLLGLVFGPVLFDTVFYRVLRQPFILWHMVFVTGMAMQLVFGEGLFLPLVDIPLPFVRSAAVLGFGLMVAGAIMFLATFVEAGTMPARLERVLRFSAVWMAGASAFHALGLTGLGTLSSDILYLSGIPVGIVFAWAAFGAWRGGSRMVGYVVLGFAPFLAVVTIRMVTYVMPNTVTDEANHLFLAGMVIEAGATALGVATRFLALRDERDRARSEARTLETLAGRDPLTGLLNRRAVEPRFAELRLSGYETFALLDLDHFKAVNDRHGHATGDAVLVAVAEVLAAEPDCVAMRLGGEEFLVLLNGRDATERAERMRAAIPARVARSVEGLAAPVTASMGMVVAPHAALPRAKFNDLYVMADKLLYEAKTAGRNRTLSERVRAFRRHGRDRRVA